MPCKGKWALPGGFVEYGENPQNAIIRELKEETGLHTEIKDLLNIFSIDSILHGHVIVAIYNTRIISGEERAGDDVSAVRYFPINGLPPLAFNCHLMAIQQSIQKGA